jgi:hypothetical protein
MILHILKFMFYTQLSDITPYIRSTLVAVFICILVLVLLKLISRSRRPLPPGPKGSFLVGNAFQMPTKYEWLTYTEWRKKYGGPCSHLLLIRTEFQSHPNRRHCVLEYLWKTSGHHKLA